MLAVYSIKFDVKYNNKKLCYFPVKYLSNNVLVGVYGWINLRDVSRHLFDELNRHCIPSFVTEYYDPDLSGVRLISHL